MNWIQVHAAQLPEAPVPNEANTVETDELYTFVGEKKQDLQHDHCWPSDTLHLGLAGQLQRAWLWISGDVGQQHSRAWLVMIMMPTKQPYTRRDPLSDERQERNILSWRSQCWSALLLGSTEVKITLLFTLRACLAQYRQTFCFCLQPASTIQAALPELQPTANGFLNTMVLATLCRITIFCRTHYVCDTQLMVHPAVRVQI